MIAEFVERWEAKKDSVRAAFAAKKPTEYIDIVREVVRVIGGDYDCGSPSVDRIVKIDDGDYQGTLVFVIGAGGCQPSEYWYVKVFYGSCSVCDTLERINSDSYDEIYTEGQLNDWMTLALHVLQGIKAMDET
jgi:hypothetical protein